MSKRWYEHWLRKASEAERRNDIGRAVNCLSRARKHTFDADELFHLDLWRKRLLKGAW